MMESVSHATNTYYARYDLLSQDGKDTGMHVTIFFRHDTTHEKLEEIKKVLDTFQLHGKHVKLMEMKYLDGPHGEPSTTKTCLLEILDQDGHTDQVAMDMLAEFSNKFSFRNYLKEQHRYAMHTSIGNTDPTDKRYHEFEKNQKTIDQIGGIGSLLTLGFSYIKNLDTRALVFVFDT